MADGREEFNKLQDMLLLPGPKTIRREEDPIAAPVKRQSVVPPENITAVDGDEPGHRLQQGRLAGSVGTDQTDDRIAGHVE
jgi:hypothetical protein